MKNPSQDSFEPVYNVLEEPDQEPSENPNYFGSILSEQLVYTETLYKVLYIGRRSWLYKWSNI